MSAFHEAENYSRAPECFFLKTVVPADKRQRQNEVVLLHDLAGSNVLDERKHKGSAVRSAWLTRVRQKVCM